MTPTSLSPKIGSSDRMGGAGRDLQRLGVELQARRPRRPLASSSSVIDVNGGLGTEGTFDLSGFRRSYCRVTVIDAHGRRAWSKPIWP
jgi:hypothetical protein